MCRVLGVSASGYYAWRKRRLVGSGARRYELTAEIRAIHKASRGTYGAPRVHAELVATGHHVGRKRVARLMHAAGFAGRQPTQVVHDDRARPTRARRRIWSQRHFTATARISCGSPTSPTSRRRRLPVSRGRARCLEPPDRRLGDGHATCGPSWCSTRSTWRSSSGAPAT